MAAQILVAVKRNERLAEIIPYVERIAQPGMRVVLLFPYPVTGNFTWLGDHWVTTESTREAMLAGRALVERYSWELQKGLAEHRALAAGEALVRKGIEVAVEVYTGSLKKVLREDTASERVHLIMMRAGSDHWMMELLRRIPPLVGFRGESSTHPVLLFCPRQA